MNTVILNDEIIAKAVSDFTAEQMALSRPATVDDAARWLDEARPYEYEDILPSDTVCGEFIFAREKPFGFVSSSHGDVFVPPSLAGAFHDGDVVACLARNGDRGLFAAKAAPVMDYITWHYGEIAEKVMKIIDRRNAETLRWNGNRDPSMGWPAMKDACDKLGLHLVEVKKDVERSTYGGRGTDTYTFDGSVTEEQANQVLDALHARHADDEPTPTFHGSDHITLTPNGFSNEWLGPWDD